MADEHGCGEPGLLDHLVDLLDDGVELIRRLVG